MAEEPTEPTPTPLQVISCKLRAGRGWTVERAGRLGTATDRVRSLKREYIIVLNRPLGANDEMKSTSIPGLPHPGEAHPVHEGLYVKDIDFDEGDGSDKRTLKATVNYETDDAETEASDSQDSPDIAGAVVEWGWDDATGTRELVTDVDGKAVLNSAGDPFQSVPSVTTYTPTFTKVIKTVARQSGALEYNCKVNDEQNAPEIGGVTFPEATLLCSVAESRLFDDPRYNYKYTIRLRYQSNVVKVGRQDPAVEIGWDVAITDAGMRELDAHDKLVNIKKVDGETGQLVTVTSPDLLNGSGHTLSETQDRVPYVLRFKAYDRAAFPRWFYSEPDVPRTPTPPPDPE